MKQSASISYQVKIFSAVLLLGVIIWLWLSNHVLPIGSRPDASQRHILERLSEGITSTQLAQVNQQGIEAYIQQQLNPEQISESPRLEQQLAALETVNQKPIKFQREESLNRQKIRKENLSPEQQKKLQQQIRKNNLYVRDQAMDAYLLRAIYSERQLQEVMVDFWFNHFNVSINRASAIRLWINDYTNQIRAHALGNFSDLLTVTAKHPAMLIYLDNEKSFAPNSPAGKRNKKGLNENYARELLELHTLGVDGGYSQEDIVALARIFTGWGVDRLGEYGDREGFFFFQRRHDNSDKIFLGHKISAGGIREGEQAIDILAHHPATAGFISYKLAQYFVADQPPESLVKQLSQSFLDTEGNIRAVMNTLIHSQEFNDPKYYGQKFKTPYQYLISLIRMAEIEQPNFQRLRGMLNQLSMPLFNCSAPTGYRNIKSAWLNPQSILQRTSLAVAISNGALNRDHAIESSQLVQNMGTLSPHTKQTIAQNNPRLRPALMMGSPEAMFR